MLRVMDSDAPLSPTKRTRLNRLAERGSTDRRHLYALLDAGLICHLGVLTGGYVTVMPTVYGRSGDTLYVHGSSANRTLKSAAGTQVCVTVTHLDGLVLGRSVFHHSANYRSAMIFGTAREVKDDPERLRGLRAIIEQMSPGQWEAARQPTRKELAATTVLAVPLAEASVKIRTGPPKDEPEDYRTGIWAGVLPVRTVVGEPEPDPALAPGVEAPAHITGHRMGAAPLRVRSPSRNLRTQCGCHSASAVKHLGPPPRGRVPPGPKLRE
jgi:nitroimidazol reductase NimA-like FMN-containing flavoprotein (pyridoxamine 5'-phosphate oxidase superfamily)